MSGTDWFWLVFTVVWPPFTYVLAWLIARAIAIRLGLRPVPFSFHRGGYGNWALTCGILAVIDASVPAWPAVPAAGVMLVIGWWLCKPKPPRWLKRAGNAVAEARKAVMVRTMRERARVRPVLVPGGAR